MFQDPGRTDTAKTLKQGKYHRRHEREGRSLRGLIMKTKTGKEFQIICNRQLRTHWPLPFLEFLP